MPGHLQEAIDEYRKAIAFYQAAPDRNRDEHGMWNAHFDLGLALAQVPGQEQAAIAEYETALRLKPDSAKAHFQLGNAFHKAGRLPEAVAEYRASIALDPEAPEVLYELAYALAQIPGQVPEAIAECRKMLELRPDDGPGRQLMASLVAFENGRGQ
jgi:tetratricopeptide (TPR) repeat protein